MERVILAIIVGCAFASRAVAIWLSRPEFVGWFNHSYYYWVQAEAVVERGRLAFADLPLTFYLYAAVSQLLQLFGQAPQASIVNAARLVMSIAPALIAVPFYLLSRRINGGSPLSVRQWVPVAVCAFLPFTFAHMPEILQKNMLGMLLLSGFVYAAFAWLQSGATRWLVGAATLFVLIALTHLGTLAVTLLACLSALLAVLYDKRDARQAVVALLPVVAAAAAGLAAVFVFDEDALARLARYAQSSLSNSLLAGVLSSVLSSESLAGKLLSLAGILVPLGAAVVLAKNYRRHRESLEPADRTLWLGSIVLAYLLVLPVVHVELIPRLLLFAPLPLLVVLNYHLRYGGKRTGSALAGVAALGVLVMVFGETMSLIRLYPHKDDIHRELLDVRERYRLSANDFVLTTYAVNPVCNWFLGTRSGLITAFNENDVGSNDRLFVLNTLERPPRPIAGGERQVVRTAAARYDVMRHDVPLPADLDPPVRYEFLAFYELRQIPDTWLFDADGNWIGWRE